jgi:hypothetical protein
MARTDRQSCEDHSVTTPENCGDTVDAERAEDRDTHESTVDSWTGRVKERVTAVIPTGGSSIPPSVTTVLRTDVDRKGPST